MIRGTALVERLEDKVREDRLRRLDTSRGETLGILVERS